MKKLISIFAALSILFCSTGCGNKAADGRITKIGDTEIDEVTYNFFFNTINEQLSDEEKSREMANKEIEKFYMPIEVGKKLGLNATSAADYKNQIRGGATEEQYQEFLKENNINDEFITKYAEALAYAEAINQYVENNVTNEVDAEEFFKQNYLRAKHVLILTEDMSDSEKADKKKQAEDIFERAKSGEDFDALVKEFSEDPGSQSYPDGYVFPEGQMVDEFYQGTKNIGIGEYNLVESSYGYHIIKRLALDETQELFDKFYAEADVETQISSTLVDKFIEEKVEEFKIKVK